MATVYVATTGNDTTGDGSSGNPYATPGKAAGVATTSGDIIALKSGTYTTTTTSSNVAGGQVSLAAGVRMEGYQTTLGDLAARPVLKAHTGSMTLVTIGGDQAGAPAAMVVNVEVDANGQSSVIGFYGGAILAACDAYLCIATNCATGFSSVQAPVGCTAVGCTSGFVLVATGSRAAFCWANGGTAGFDAASNGVALFGCLATGCSGKGFTLNYQVSCVNCTAYGCSGDGFDVVANANYPLCAFVNCIAYGNGAYGFRVHAGGVWLALYNAYGANTSGNFSTSPGREIAGVSLSADPFTNAAGGDFSLNNTAGGGAACRAAGFPGAFPGGLTTGYLDIGAAQHQDAGGGGSSGGLHMGGLGMTGIGVF